LYPARPIPKKITYSAKLWVGDLKKKVSKIGKKYRRVSKAWKWLAILMALTVVGGGGYFGVKWLLSIGDDSEDKDSVPDTYTGDGKWVGQLVNKQITCKNKFNGTAVACTAKVYAEKPGDLGNPRGDFTDSSKYETFTATSGVITVQDYPGEYYVILTATGYNTDFIGVTDAERFVIPDGSGTPATLSLSDYNSAPNTDKAKMTLTPTLTVENATMTLTNETAKKVTEYMYATVGDDTEFRGWKAVVTDVEGIKDDADSDGTYDEGVSILKVTIGSTSKEVFNPSKGINLFDTNSKYEIELKDVVIADGNQLPVKVEITSNTGDYTGANDEIWGEGEGSLVKIDLFDQEGTNRGTVEVVA